MNEDLYQIVNGLADNQQAHLDLEADLNKAKDGLITFMLRVDRRKIVDYVLMNYQNDQNTDPNVAEIIIQKLEVAYTTATTSGTEPVLSDNSQRPKD